MCEEKGLEWHMWPLDPEWLAGRFDVGVVASFGPFIPPEIINAFPQYALLFIFIFLFVFSFQQLASRSHSFYGFCEAPPL